MMMPPRPYVYVGPPEIKQRSKRGDHCRKVASVEDVLGWTNALLPKGQTRSTVPATFIIDTHEELWIADRHLEHVACAAGQAVLAAGEIFFERHGKHVGIEEITNQSTGYCPEPDCWGIVARVVDRAGICRPMFFTAAFTFRRCDRCGTTNVVKENVFECAVCLAPLSRVWNYAPAS